MALETKLEVYNFGVRQKRSHIYLPLNGFHKEDDILSFFQSFISEFEKSLHVDEAKKKSLQFVPNSLKVQSRFLSGIVESGEYGQETKIVNRKSGRQKGIKEVDDLDVRPFYFLMYLPEDRNLGMLLLQRSGHFGINTVFTHRFKEYFAKRYDDLIVDFNPYVSTKLAQEFIENGSINEVQLRRYDVPSDVAEKLGMISYHQDILSIEIRITSKPRKGLRLKNRVKAFIKNSNAKLFDIKALENIGMDGRHKSSIKVKHGNNTRVIDLSDTGKIRPYYDIENDVEKDSKQHPTFVSIDRVAKSLVADLLE